MIPETTKIRSFVISLAFAVGLLGATTASAVKPSERFTVVDLAVAANAPGGALEGQLDYLITFVSGDDVVLKTLSGNGQFTVFAPTDAAFETLLGALEDNCINPTDELVREVLLYHVVRGRRDSGDVLATERFRTLSRARFTQAGGVITDNAGQNAVIFSVDNFADNGVVHAIDTVLLPFPVESGC